MFFFQASPNDPDRSTYVLGSGSEAVVVDPGDDVTRYMALAAAEGARIRFVIETQAGDAEPRELLIERCGAAALIPAGSEADGAPTIVAGDVLRVGSAQIEPFSVPGSGPDHLAYAITDLASSDRPFVVLGGMSDVGQQLIAA